MLSIRKTIRDSIKEYECFVEAKRKDFNEKMNLFDFRRKKKELEKEIAMNLNLKTKRASLS